MDAPGICRLTLRAKRHAYVSLNGAGERLDKIATYLGMSAEEARQLVHVTGDKEVVEWCVCDTGDDGAISFPYIEKPPLFGCHRRGAQLLADESRQARMGGTAMRRLTNGREQLRNGKDEQLRYRSND